MTDQVGRKDDNGKPMAGTVLAGFRDVLNTHFAIAGSDMSKVDGTASYDLAVCRSALLVYLDTALTIEQRLIRSASILRDSAVAVRASVDVGSYGARKYDRDNWLHVDDGISRYYEAGGRHVLDMLCGVAIDDPAKGGSGLPNLAHWAWNVFAGATLAAKAVK